LDKRNALLISCLSAFFIPFMASSINVALPSMSEEFTMTAFEYGWIATSYLLTTAIFLVPFGRLADIYGRKKVFLLGVWVFTFTSAFCALAPSTVPLIFLRLIQGVGSAMMFSTMIAILTSVYPLAERGKVIGINTAVVYIGLSIGPFLGGMLTGVFGWRSLFLVLLPLSIPILYIGHIRLKGEWAEAKGERFDKSGSAIYAFSLSGVVIGFSMLPDLGGIMLTLLGTLGILLFVWWELRSKSPVLDIQLFRRNRVFAFSNLAALINYGATFAVGFLMSPYLQVVRGFDPWNAGLLLMVQPAVMAVFSPIAGRLSDRIEPRLLATSGMAITTAGLFLFAALSKDTSLELIVANLAFIGLGFALFSSPNTNAIMCSVERRHYGTASASVGTMRSVGQVISLGIATLCISLFIGELHISPVLDDEFVSGMQLAFTIFSVLCLIGTFASMARGNVRNNGPRERGDQIQGARCPPDGQ
jgi:EmrB/QacA subfamily drug resistance transporter